MDANAWITIAGLVCSSAFTVAMILYHRGRADSDSKGRFKLNEARIGEQATRIDTLAVDVKALQHALMENSVALARIDERGIHMADAVRRIEDKIDANTIVVKPK